jgi:hypothetical protein
MGALAGCKIGQPRRPDNGAGRPDDAKDDTVGGEIGLCGWAAWRRGGVATACLGVAEDFSSLAANTCHLAL